MKLSSLARTRAAGRRRIALAAVLGIALVASVAGWASGSAGRVTKAQPGALGPSADAGPGAKPADVAPTVRILFQTVPPRRARVKWGRKLLGIIRGSRPLVVVRPRDSGPMDVVILANGYLPVHTRAYTFTNSRVAVRLTPPEEENTLFGYKQEPPPAVDGGVLSPDALPP